MRLKRTLTRLAAVALTAVLFGAAVPAWAAPTVTLTTLADQPTLQVGATTTLIVSASISGAASNDGIIAFDIDLFPLFKSGIHFTSLATLDPSAFVVSTGTADPSTGGILGISGLYTTSTTQGVGTTVNLFTVQVQADAVGANSVSAGLSVYPNGTGIPFQLANLGDYIDPSSGTPTFLVDSSSAVAPLNVSAAPEPSTALLSLTLLASALLTRRRLA